MIVYKLTNTINKQFYIGITTGDIKQRLRNHKQKSGIYLQNAMKKYGKENFIIEQIDTAKTEDELDRKEIHYIKTLKPHYNLTEGGRTFFHHTQLTKDRIAKGNKVAKIGNTYRKGMTFTKESREQISKSLLGNTNKLGKTGANKNPYKGEYWWLKGDNNPAKRPAARAKLRQAALNRYK